jgi:hypothetical protein
VRLAAPVVYTSIDIEPVSVRTRPDGSSISRRPSIEIRVEDCAA